jgi:hypothetical protein
LAALGAALLFHVPAPLKDVDVLELASLAVSVTTAAFTEAAPARRADKTIRGTDNCVFIFD